MEISTAPDSIGPAVGMAVQKMLLDTTKSDGAGILNLIAAVPAGSTNSPTQGRFLDARA